jgi:isopenicillin-N N-acyltransferase-like protein
MIQPTPIVVSEGTPYRRGYHLGSVAADRIAHTISAYMAMFRLRAGLRRDGVREQAERFMPVIERATPALFDEMRGIADGAGRDLRDVVAINARTELLYGSCAPPECTAVGAVPPATADGHIRLGQNWDWHPSQAGALVLWILLRDDGPDVLTLTEAGMVGKIGANAAGLAICVNLLTSDGDHMGPALPMHVILRHVLDTAQSVDEAVGLLTATERCTSCNHLLADRRGMLADVESTPRGQAVLHTDRGILTHTNHCLDRALFAHDRGAREHAETIARGERAEQLALDTPLDAGAFRAILSDHAHAPYAICRHGWEGQQPEEQAMTIAAIVCDLTAGTVDLADGTPCSAQWRTIDLARLLHSGAPAEPRGTLPGARAG